ncbi:MAG TPA: hypothetical protein QGH16_01435 [Verrucomicrobiota bacterium]|jgi:hypothetical protein|nr:hypothetical protein [Verrucomicrobiota bacterium]
MSSLRNTILALSLFAMGTPSFAADKPAIRQVSNAGIRHSILICGKLTQLINEKSEVIWQVNEHSRDGSVLMNGNILFSANNVAKEMTRDMKVVWRYALTKPNKELGTVWRLANDNTLVVERGPKPRLLEITNDGNFAVEVPLKPETDNGHMQTRMARKLANGNYIVPHLLAFKVKEYKPDGTVVNEIKTDLAELGGRAAENWPFTAIRVANGNTVVNLTHGNKTVEFDRDGKVVWRVDNSDVNGRFADPCGGQRLPNGNTVISSYAQRNPDKVRIFEVNHEKEVVWELFHPNSNAHGIHVISSNGKPISDTSLK